jgi:hypothetical protein
LDSSPGEGVAEVGRAEMISERFEPMLVLVAQPNPGRVLLQSHRGGK